MGDPDVTRGELLAEVWALVSEPKLGPEWFTAGEMAEQTGERLDTVRNRLNKGVESGILEKFQAYKNRSVYYRKVTHDRPQRDDNRGVA